MRIVQLANLHTPESGGIRTTLAALRAGYRRAGHDPVLVVPGPVDDEVSIGEERVIIVASPLLPGGSGYRIVIDRARINAILDQLAPDRVEISDRLTLLTAATWARRHGVPAVLIAHERLDAVLSAVLPAALPRRHLVHAWNRRTVRMVDRVVVTSRYGARELEQVGAHNLVRVPLGVDLETFRPRPSTPRSRPRLVYVGRLSREKRPDLAVEALRALLDRGVDAELVVAGSGPLKDQLQRRALGFPVEFRGFVPSRRDLAALVGDADVAIAPCPGECFGLAALEALACGTPVVAVDGGGAAELLTLGAGLAVPAPGPGRSPPRWWRSSAGRSRPGGAWRGPKPSATPGRRRWRGCWPCTRPAR